MFVAMIFKSYIMQLYGCVKILKAITEREL